MTLALVTSLWLCSAPAAPPPSASLLGQLPVRQGLLVEELGSAQRGFEIYRGVKNVVAGSVLLALAAGSLTGGIYALTQAPLAVGGLHTALLALGWTFTGLGILFAVIGIPLLIVGIVQLSHRPPGHVQLGVTERGALAVFF